MPKDMFDSYLNINPNYIPDNRARFLCRDEQDEIVVGGSATHVFKLHFLASKVCATENWFEIVYKQSIDPVLICDSQTPGVIVEETLPNDFEPDGTTVISVTLSPETTKLFVPHRDTFAQIRIKLNDNSIIFGDINKINVVDTLENNNPYINKEEY